MFETECLYNYVKIQISHFFTDFYRPAFNDLFKLSNSDQWMKYMYHIHKRFISWHLCAGNIPPSLQAVYMYQYVYLWNMTFKYMWICVGSTVIQRCGNNIITNSDSTKFMFQKVMRSNNKLKWSRIMRLSCTLTVILTMINI